MCVCVLLTSRVLNHRLLNPLQPSRGNRNTVKVGTAQQHQLPPRDQPGVEVVEGFFDLVRGKKMNHLCADDAGDGGGFEGDLGGYFCLSLCVYVSIRV